MGTSGFMPVNNESIGDEGVALIAAGLPQLIKLDVSKCGITDKGVEAIAKNLPNLKELDLGTPLSDIRQQSGH